MLSDRELLEIIQDFRSSTWRAVTLVHDEMEISLTKRRPGDPVVAPPSSSSSDEAAHPIRQTGSGGQAADPVHVAAPAEEVGETDAATSADSDIAGEAETISADTVGIFWVAPAPGAEPFVSVGDVVEPGQQVGIVEVMKLMTNVVSTRGGIVEEVLAENGQSVEAGQPLIRLADRDGGR